MELETIENKNADLVRAVTTALEARDAYRNENRREYARLLEAAGLGVGYQFLRSVPKRGQTYSRTPEREDKRFVVTGLSHELKISVERVSLKNEPIHPGEGYGMITRAMLQEFAPYRGDQPVKISTWAMDSWKRLVGEPSDAQPFD
jgi:hypothetical protein